jgi:chitinase
MDFLFYIENCHIWNHHSSYIYCSDSAATAFADQLWNMFFGGSSSTRPFGSAILDGIDLDIENGGSTGKNKIFYCHAKYSHLMTVSLGYVAFITQLQSHFSSATKKYYITAAPQCVYPDANLGAVINSIPFDAIYIQFCKLALSMYLKSHC